MSLNLEGIIFSDFANNLVTKEWYLKASILVEDLSQVEIVIVLALAMVLLSFIVYKKLGPMVMLALLFFYLICYVLFQFDLLKVYEERELNSAKHMQLIQEELDK